MLRRLGAKNFKSLVDIDLELPRLSVLFGPNAAGKSNVIDALLVLSRLASERTVADAIDEPVRGHPFELLTLPSGGVAELMKKQSSEFSLSADLDSPELGSGTMATYDSTVSIVPRTGEVRVASELLQRRYIRSGKALGNPKLETTEGEIRIRREGQGRPNTEPVGLNYTQLSNLRLTGDPYRTMDIVRNQLSGFRTYYLDPRTAMRQGLPPREVSDIGPLGADIAPFLFRLKHTEPTAFKAVNRLLRHIIPSVRSVDVELDEQRGIIDVTIRQDSIEYPSRIVSEGTLRVLALCCIAANPWPGTLVAFEEPENGVHPRRLELVARLLFSLAVDRGQQVLVTTHSPLFCQEVLRLTASSGTNDAGLILVGRDGTRTTLQRLATDSLFVDSDLEDAITSGTEDGKFESLVLQGMVGG